MTNRKLNKIFDKITEKLLTLSGALTSITIVFITIFLFQEGAGLFKNQNIEQGYGLYINAKNKIEQLSPKETKEIFDAEITN